MRDCSAFGVALDFGLPGGTELGWVLGATAQSVSGNSPSNGVYSLWFWFEASNRDAYSPGANRPKRRVTRRSPRLVASTEASSGIGEALEENREGPN